PPQRPAVSRHRQLLVGAAVDVIKDRPRDQPARRGPQVADVVAGRQPSARAVELDRLYWDQASYLRCPNVRDDTRSRPAAKLLLPVVGGPITLYIKSIGIIVLPLQN